MPNFIFKEASLDRYEKNDLALKVNFKKLEIYDKEKIWAGEKIHFVQMGQNKDPKTKTKQKRIVESKGYAGLIKINEKKDKYFLGEKVFFEDVKEKLLISGKAFFWDKKTGLLYAPTDDIISIKKADELNIKGSGFVANTNSKEFEFSNSIEGEIKTEKPEEEAKKPQDANKKNEEGKGTKNE